jgi:hypothetical protein
MVVLSSLTLPTSMGLTTKLSSLGLRVGYVDGNRNLILENNRLKKELEITYRVLGKCSGQKRSHLGWNRNKTSRIWTLAGVVIPTPTKKRRTKGSGTAEVHDPTQHFATPCSLPKRATPTRRHELHRHGEL